MELRLINQNMEKYGFPLTITLNDNFKGHQWAAAAGIVANDGVIEKNFIDSTVIPDENERNQKLINLIHEALLISQPIRKTINDGKIVRDCQIYYVPYMIRGHSTFIPTVNNKNITPNVNEVHEISVELLLIPPNMNELKRYITLHFKTTTAPILSCIQGIFKSDLEEYKDIFVPKKENDKVIGYETAFYNDVGMEKIIIFTNKEAIYSCITSVRIIGFETIEKGEEENAEHDNKNDAQ